MYEHFKELIELGDKLCENNDFTFEFSIIDSIKNPETKGYASVSIESDKRNVVVYAKNLVRYTFLKDERLNIFTDNLMTLYHEMTHVKQFYDCQNGNAEPEIMFEFLARQNNEILYRSNYFTLVYETQAEMEGALSAYQYLTENHGLNENTAMECLKNCLVERYKKKPSMQKAFENCKTIEDVKAEFESVYKKNLETSLEYIHIDKTNCEDNHLISYMYNELGDKKFNNIMTLLGNSKNQIKFIAAFSLTKNPEYRDFFKCNEIKYLDIEDYNKAYDAILDYCYEREHFQFKKSISKEESLKIKDNVKNIFLKKLEDFQAERINLSDKTIKDEVNDPELEM